MILLVLLGLLIGTFASYICSASGLCLSPMMLSLFCFTILIILFRKYRFLLAISVSFVFLVFFLSFRFHNKLSLSALTAVVNSYALPIILFTYVLVPFSLLAITVDFYSTVNFLPRYLGRGLFLPILIKRELLLQRHKIIIESLFARGVNVAGFRGHISKLHLWLIPLIRTAIMEGVESHEYNQMLQTEIQQFRSKHTGFLLAPLDMILLTLIGVLVIIRFAL